MITIHIDPTQTVESIRETFRKAFPYLTIECFSKPAGDGAGNFKKNMFSPDTLLATAMAESKKVTITCNPETTVHALEELFRTQAGMNVQVFRRSGKLWLETTATDSWTLEKQNDEGKKSTVEIKEEIENPNDHDMY